MADAEYQKLSFLKRMALSYRVYRRFGQSIPFSLYWGWKKARGWLPEKERPES